MFSKRVFLLQYVAVFACVLTTELRELSLIDKSYEIAPTNCSITDYEGNVVTDLVGEEDLTIDGPYFRCIGENITWSINPSLPSGLELTASNFIIGSPHVALNRTLFNVTATNNGGSCSTTFFITIHSCQYGYRITTKTDTHWNYGIFSLRKGYDVIAESTLISEQLFCIPYDTYKYVITCNRYTRAQEFCSVQIVDSKGLSFLRLKIPVGGIADGIINFADKAAPTVRMVPSVLSASKNSQVVFSLDVIGFYNHISFNPPLPDTIKYNTNEDEYRGYFTEKGVTNYNVTVSGPGGKVDLAFVVAIDVCPKGMIDLEQSVYCSECTSVVLDSHQNIMHRSSGPGEYRLCLSEDDDTTIRMVSESYSDEHSRSMILKDRYNIVTRYAIPDDQLSIEFHLTLHSYIPERSILKYSHVAFANWNSPMFDDGSWKEAKVDGWGYFDQETSAAYFRKHFLVRNPLILNNIMIDVMLQDGCIIFMNGKEVIHHVSPTNPSDLSVIDRFRYFVPMSFVHDGDNIISIELHRAASTPIGSAILFDLFVQGDFERCTPHSHDINATDDQTVPTLYPPKDALSPTGLFWMPATLPATLILTFNGNRSEVITWIAMTFVGDTLIPTVWHVEGVREDNTTDLLYEVKNVKYMIINHRVNVKINSKFAYHIIKLVFTEASVQTTTAVRDVELYSCNSMACKKKWGKKGKITDEIIYGKCPITRIGVNRLVCSNIGNKAVWVTSGCERIHPPQSMAYIDTYLRFSGVSIDDWLKIGSKKTIKSEMAIIFKELTIKESETEFLSVRDVSTADKYIFEVYMRFTVEYEIGDYIIKKELAMMETLNYILRAALIVEYPSLFVEFINKPVLRTPVRVGLVVFIAVTLIILLLIVMYLFIRSRKSIHRKSLSRHTEKKSLLEEFNVI